MKKKVAAILLLLLVAIQFIRPSRNESTGIATNDITQHYYIAPEVLELLQRSCYDCHSNHTEYPWYTNIQPVGWWMASHVNDGKRHLNFHEFGSYTIKKQDHSMEDIIETLEKKEMPLPSYLWMHGEAKLSEEDIALLIGWAKKLRAEIAAVK